MAKTRIWRSGAVNLPQEWMGPTADKPADGTDYPAGSTYKDTTTGAEYAYDGAVWQPYSRSTSIVGSLANVVTLQTTVIAVDNGTPRTPTSPETLTFEISGTSTSRTVVFELAGPSGVYIAHPAIKVGDTTYTNVTSTTLGTTASPVSYEVDIPANYSFRARVSAVAGGNVSIAGWAVGQ